MSAFSSPSSPPNNASTPIIHQPVGKRRSSADEALIAGPPNGVAATNSTAAGAGLQESKQSMAPLQTSLSAPKCLPSEQRRRRRHLFISNRLAVEDAKREIERRMGTVFVSPQPREDSSQEVIIRCQRSSGLAGRFDLISAALSLWKVATRWEGRARCKDCGTLKETSPTYFIASFL